MKVKHLLDPKAQRNEPQPKSFKTNAPNGKAFYSWVHLSVGDKVGDFLNCHETAMNTW